MGFPAQETVWICVTNGRKTMNLCCRSNTILVLVLGLLKNLFQVSNPPGAVSSLALYKVETSASPCLLTGNGHVSSSESRVASRYTCNLHQHKFFAEQGTQTVKTSNRFKKKETIYKSVEDISYNFGFTVTVSIFSSQSQV